MTTPLDKPPSACHNRGMKNEVEKVVAAYENGTETPLAAVKDADAAIAVIIGTIVYPGIDANELAAVLLVREKLKDFRLQMGLSDSGETFLFTSVSRLKSDVRLQDALVALARGELIFKDEVDAAVEVIFCHFVESHIFPEYRDLIEARYSRKFSETGLLKALYKAILRAIASREAPELDYQVLADFTNYGDLLTPADMN